MYMDDIKLFKKNERDSNTNNKNIQSGYRNYFVEKNAPCS